MLHFPTSVNLKRFQKLTNANYIGQIMLNVLATYFHSIRPSSSSVAVWLVEPLNSKELRNSSIAETETRILPLGSRECLNPSLSQDLKTFKLTPLYCAASEGFNQPRILCSPMNFKSTFTLYPLPFPPTHLPRGHQARGNQWLFL